MRTGKSSVGAGCAHGVTGGIPQKPENYKKTFKELLKILRPQYFKIFTAIFFVFLSVVFSVITPKLLGTITTRVFDWVSKGQAVDLYGLLQTIIILAVLYILSTVFMYIENYKINIISQDLVSDLRSRLEKKINRIPVSRVDTMGIGEIQSRLTNDINTISTCISDSLSQIAKAVITVAGIVAIILSSNLLLALVVIAMIPVSTVITFIITKISQKHYSENHKYAGMYNNHIEEVYSNLSEIKGYNYLETNNQKFNELNSAMKEKSFKAVILSGMIMPALHFMENINYVVIAVLGCYMVSENMVLIGDVQAFIQYSKQFNQPINQLANVSSIIQSTLAAAERVFDFLEEQEEEDKGRDYLSDEKNNGAITFEDVHFSYGKTKVINGLNIDIESGQTVALVGHTGAGKTTIVNLLMRFYEVSSGRININGIDIKDIPRHRLREMVSMVLQDAWLFNGTIFENIVYGKPGATYDEVVEAANQIGIHDYIMGLESGYDTVINEMTSNISGGQKQLITIARAMLKNPDIFILDEATSSVDTRTELLIQNALTKILNNKTCIIIAHRLSTIISADRILVLKDGNIIETGTHDELINKRGNYYALYNSQF